MPRYFFDEHIKRAVAEQLRLRGIGVLTAQEAGRAQQRIPDVDVLRYAARMRRTLVTADRDFITLSVIVQPHAGILLHQRQLSIGDLVEYLKLVAQLYEPDEIADRLLYRDW